MERIRKDGYSEGLKRLARIVQNQQASERIIKQVEDSAHVALYRYDDVCWYHEGIVELPASVVVALSLDRVVEVSVDSHELLRVNGEEMSGIEHAKVLDLSDDGERWEGDVLQNKPFGWGVVYDSENRMAYEGFRIGEVNVCYGTQYYPDIQKVEYEGEWCEGKRYGNGILYDRNGRVVFDGEWVNDHHEIDRRIVINQENPLLHNRIEELTVSDSSCNGKEWRVLDLSLMSKLQILKVGNNCFEHVMTVKLIGLKRLKSVVVGNESFYRMKIGGSFDPNRHFYLKNCPSIQQLKMGRYAFADYCVCEIEDVPSLEVIEMGELNESSFNFYYASLELKSIFQRRE